MKKNRDLILGEVGYIAITIFRFDHMTGENRELSVGGSEPH